MLNNSSSKNSTTVRPKNLVRLTRAALQTAYILSDDLGTSFAERLFTSPRRHRRPPRERDVLAAGRESIVDVKLRAPRWHGAHVPVTMWRWGVGPAVLLVHGWEGRGSQLGAFVAPVVAAGMSVIAFDAPGHGSSPDHRLYLTDMADTIADVAETVGPLHGIIAHSFGAAAVLVAHLTHRVRAPRNVMLAPNVLIEDALVRFARVVGLDDADRAALAQRIGAHTGLDIAALRLECLTADRDDALLVLHDRSDREVSFEHAEAIERTWPNAQLVEAAGLGHRRILRDADVVSRVVDFVRFGVPLPASDLVREIDRQLEAVQ